MAEGVLFDFAGNLLGSLASLAYQELALAWYAKAEIEKLKHTVSTIKAVVRDAEEQQRNNNSQVADYLGQLKDALYDVDDLLDDLSTEVLRRRMMSGNETVKEVRVFFSESNQFAYSLKIGHRVKAIRERLDKIAADKAKFHFTDRPVELPVELKERDQTHSFVRAEEVIGRDEDKKKILGLLLNPNPEEDVSVVPIIGMGGLGKTTLAKMVFNDENVRERFELKMWVCVSEKFEVKVIAEKIIEAAIGSKPDKDLQMETLQNQLRENINGKKYLLFLDDVWNEDPQKWRNLRDLLLDGARGSWIVITTRSGLVAKITRTRTILPHELEGLSESESWELLKLIAFKEQSQESNNSRLEEIGMEIAKQCKGVPLALRAIGGVLVKIRRTEGEWSKVKKNVLNYITQQENDIMPILKLSYDHLPPQLRHCFAYCSLIPKDTQFQVRDLIIHWMAQGFIQQAPSGDEDLEDVGQKYFMDLLWGSFFQVAYKDDSGNVETFTMHDLMHDLACSIAGTECCIASLGAEKVNERTRHVSFEDDLDSSWKIPSTLLKAHRLRTFLGFEIDSMNLSTCSALMSSFKNLRMLDLSGLDIETLPHSIDGLKHLRALDLSRNCDIKKLPNSLCRLHNLQTLRLIDCYSLEELPRKTRRLVSLRHLCIDRCDELAYMPRGLGQLTCLRTLDKFVVGKAGRHVGQLRELNGLNNLKGELHISSLENAIPDPGSSCLKEKLSLKSLILSWEGTHVDMGDDEIVFECLQPHRNLEKLKVYDFPGSKIPSWLSSVTNLTELLLQDCVECKHLPPLHQLCSLKFLKLSNLKALENVYEIGKKKESSSAILPSLEKLELIDCPNLKGWWRGDVGEASNAQPPCFPCLSALQIKRCPNLPSMPLFPSVKEVSLTKTSWKPLQQTMRFKMTTSEALSSSPSSPLFLPFCKLQKLQLEEIEDLDSLPEEFLQSLTSLQSLIIGSCINLTSMMPDGMRYLTSLTKLRIFCCPQLSERCKRDFGVDWPNIAHIKQIRITDSLTSWERFLLGSL